MELILFIAGFALAAVVGGGIGLALIKLYDKYKYRHTAGANNVRNRFHPGGSYLEEVQTMRRVADHYRVYGDEESNRYDYRQGADPDGPPDSKAN